MRAVWTGQTVAASAFVRRGRKVRAPQGRVPGNAWEVRRFPAYRRKVPQRTYRRWPARDQARVKRCG